MRPTDTKWIVLKYQQSIKEAVGQVANVIGKDLL